MCVDSMLKLGVLFSGVKAESCRVSKKRERKRETEIEMRFSLERVLATTNVPRVLRVVEYSR